MTPEDRRPPSDPAPRDREPWQGAAWRDRAWRRREWHRGAQGPWGGWGPGAGRRRGGRHLVRGIGCAIVAFGVFAVGGLTIATWLLATLLGGGSPDPFGWLIPLGLGALAVVVVGAVFSLRTFGRLARPVADVMDATERLADGDLTTRVEETGPRQVRRLAASFNRMAERLAAAEDRRRALLADVSHELRTPLTVIGGGLEAMIDGVHPRDEAHLEPLLDETRVLARLIEDLRTLSLSEAGALELRREPVDAAELVDDVVAAFRAAADRGGIVIDAAPPDGAAIVEVDPVRIREVLSNLVANALRHTPAGGRVTVAATMAADGAVDLSVTDTGEGIAAEALASVFDRYERSDRGGSGLGLAIARSLVVAHGGEITAHSDGVPGHGTTIRVRLPARS
jgi:two-component system sensor histidine kinase BaeS